MSTVEAGSPSISHRRAGLAEVASGVDKVARRACEGMRRTKTGDPEALHSIAWSAGAICIQVVSRGTSQSFSRTKTGNPIALHSTAWSAGVICI